MRSLKIKMKEDEFEIEEKRLDTAMWNLTLSYTLIGKKNEERALFYQTHKLQKKNSHK